MKIFFVHLRVHLLQTLRQPAYIVSTLVFPSLFFLFFAHPNADTDEKARFLMGSFSVFAALGVVFFQFGVHVAQERARPWSTYLKTLPVSAFVLSAARASAALVIAVLASLLVQGVVMFTTPAEPSLKQLLALNLVVLLGAVPFCFLALLVGRWASSTAALPIANLIYLLTSFAGGLWVPPNALPERVQEFSQYLPTRFVGEMAWWSIADRSFDAFYLRSYLIYLSVFCALALISWRVGSFSFRIGPKRA